MRTFSQPQKQTGSVESLMFIKPKTNAITTCNQSAGLAYSFNNIPVHAAAPAAIQPKLAVNSPGDQYEQEADTMADKVMRMPDTGLKPQGNSFDNVIQRKCAACEEEEKGLQRKETNHVVPAVSGAVHQTLQSSGHPMDTSTRTFMETRFGHDFSKVRIHDNPLAHQSARDINALAYTYRNNIVFDAGRYSPGNESGKRLLAHELTHVVQQGGTGFAAPVKTKISNAGTNTMHLPQRNTGATGLLMRLTPTEFRKKLETTADQKSAIDALFADKTFLSLWNYLKNCPVKDKKDLGPLTLKVTPGLKIAGVERYGGYSPMARTLEINPTKPEHISNVTELVDTIVHELIHAVDDLQSVCKAAGAKDAPLNGAATDPNPLSRADVLGTPDEDRLMLELGPGASNPCEEFIDINKAAQQMIIQILKNNIKVAKVGRPTITFVNEILRTNPKAMAEYKQCRDTACAQPDAKDRSKAIAVCSADILSKYPLTPPPATKPITTPPPRKP